MMNSTLTKIALLAITLTGLGMAPALRAAHYSTYLDALQTEAGARLETNEDPALNRPLTSLNRTLNRNSKTLAQDLNLLGSTSRTLEKSFPEDETFAGLSLDSLNGFIGEAQAQLDQVEADASLSTDPLPRSLSNSLAQAHQYLDEANSDGAISSRVRSLSKAFAKIKVARLQAAHLIKAPESIEGKTVKVTWKVPGEKPQRFDLAADGNYDNGAGETGTWTYDRTSANTGTITQTFNGGDTRVLDVTFSNTRSGKFTVEGDSATGTIVAK